MALSVADAAHLLRRSGFGATPGAIHELVELGSRERAVARVLDVSLNPEPSAPPVLKHDGVGSVQNGTQRAVVQWWLELMRTSPTPIVEKMTLFWHGHFVSSPDKVDALSMLTDQNVLFRSAGLGSFHDLVQKVSVDPAMLVYLDNFANEKAAPQENFGRELMEVFTLGVGYRDEKDVLPMTRAWTGHGLDAKRRRYEFHPEQHDHGHKSLFGLPPRNWNGPAALTELLLGARATDSSRYITAKLFSFFAYPVTVEDAVVHRLSDGFRANGLNIMWLLRAIFRSEEFWSPQARWALVRSPAEWVVAAMQAINQGPLLAGPGPFMPTMGQELLHPPSVAGWGQNAYWLSTASSWGKAAWALELRKLAQNTGVLMDTRSLSPRDAADQGFRLFGIVDPAPATRQVVERWVARTRAEGDGSLVPRNLVHLLILSPDFQLA